MRSAPGPVFGASVDFGEFRDTGDFGEWWRRRELNLREKGDAETRAYPETYPGA